jgi:hypothetical protein
MFQVDPRVQASIRGVIIVIVLAGWAAYGVLGGGQIFLAVMLVLSILLVGGTFALVRKRTPGEPVRR